MRSSSRRWKKLQVAKIKIEVVCLFFCRERLARSPTTSRKWVDKEPPSKLGLSFAWNIGPLLLQLLWRKERDLSFCKCKPSYLCLLLGIFDFRLHLLTSTTTRDYSSSSKPQVKWMNWRECQILVIWGSKGQGSEFVGELAGSSRHLWESYVIGLVNGQEKLTISGKLAQALIIIIKLLLLIMTCSISSCHISWNIQRIQTIEALQVAITKVLTDH